MLSKTVDNFNTSFQSASDSKFESVFSQNETQKDQANWNLFRPVNTTKPLNNKLKDHEDYLLSHTMPAINQTISHFDADEKGRKKSTFVLDFAIKLNKD